MYLFQRNFLSVINEYIDIVYHVSIVFWSFSEFLEEFIVIIHVITFVVLSISGALIILLV